MQWMDFLRGLAVLLVVVLHANSQNIAGASVEWWSEVNRYLTPFRMPLLMFMSGMLLHRSLAKPLPLYIWGKVAAIAWPLLVWLCLYGFFVRGGLGVPNILEWQFHQDYLWFLMSLLICYTVAAGFKPLVTRAPSCHSWAYLGMFTAMIGTYVSTTIVHGGLLGSTFWYGAFFFLGAWAAPQVDRWVRVPWTVILPLFLAVAVLAHMGVDDRSLRIGSVTAAGISVAGISVVLWAAPRLARGAVVQFVEWCGRSSVVVYVAHFPIIVLLRDHVFSATDLTAGLQVMLMTGIALFLTVILVWARPWTPWLYVMPRQQRVAVKLR
ncbi:acyltransferase [Nesterenkonia natronophila]|uniref:Acyltransferase n=2 Tax=Nesterenkonia natronophila TaxID=2174932 RepID=A0A3A4F8U4_9MICC|nr:acyltransferase [Nesterenkonia natronophila]